MPAGAYVQLVAAVHDRPHVRAALRDVRKAGQHIEQRHVIGHALQTRHFLRNLLPQRADQLRFDIGDLLFGAEDARFQLFQLGRDVALRVRERLLALVVRRHLFQPRARHLEIVAEHLVVADLQ